MSVLLQTIDLTKTFGDTKEEKNTVLDKISLKIEKGEFVAIMGQSGSGKSTLLYNISGMDKMTSGDVIFEEKQYSEMSEESMSACRLDKMGFVFQQSYLLKNLSIEDNILLPGLKLRKLSGKALKERAQKLMRDMGIDHVAEHDISQVSGGQLQRAAICRALINEPDILFGDEPTGALNTGSTTAVMDILNKVNEKGTAILLVTHDAKVAARANRVIYLSDGKVQAECNLTACSDMENVKNREERINTFLKENGF